MRSLFVSYSTKDQSVAEALVEEIEGAGECHCFIAPRDIHDGDYAEQIVDAIDKADCLLLVFSVNANGSAYVLRELNSAVLRSVPIIPYRIDDTALSKSMEFYLGVVQWLDAFRLQKEERLHELHSWLVRTAPAKTSGKNIGPGPSTSIRYPDYAVLEDNETRKIGFDTRRLVMETIEIDYVALDEGEGDYVLNEEIEGSYQDWYDHVKTYPGLGATLVKEDKAVGYFEYELLNEENYGDVISGRAMVHPRMMEFYAFGGELCLYVAMFAVLKDHSSMTTVMMIWDRLFVHVERLLDMGVDIPRIGISVYSDFLKLVVKKMGFRWMSTNLAQGDVYELDLRAAKDNAALRNRYPDLYKRLTR